MLPCVDIRITPNRDVTGQSAFYYPIVYPNDFWQLRSQMVEINTTYPADPNERLVLPLSVELQPMGFTKMQIMASMTHGFEEAAKTGQGSSELDEVKRMLIETNPYLLALTALVSVLHMVYVLVPRENLQAPTNRHLYILGLKCWHSRMTCLTGGRKRSWWACRFERYEWTLHGSNKSHPDEFLLRLSQMSSCKPSSCSTSWTITQKQVG